MKSLKSLARYRPRPYVPLSSASNTALVYKMDGGRPAEIHLGRKGYSGAATVASKYCARPDAAMGRCDLFRAGSEDALCSDARVRRGDIVFAVPRETLLSVVRRAFRDHETMFEEITRLSGGHPRFFEYSLTGIDPDPLVAMLQCDRPAEPIRGRFGPIIDDAWDYRVDISTPDGLRAFLDGGHANFLRIVTQIEYWWASAHEFEGDVCESLLLVKHALGLSVAGDVARLNHARHVEDYDCAPGCALCEEDDE